MLNKSKPRHPIVGPITDFSCQNVFYMPQKLPKRPSSAPNTARRQSVPVKKFAVPAKRKPQRVLQGSKQEAKIISKVSSICQFGCAL